jgi:hypothetical protein
MKKIIAMVVTLAMLAGCSPEIRVHTDHDPEYNLLTYKTFDWSQKTDIESGKNPLYYNELNDKRIKTAVGEQLTKRGYTQADENPDLILHYHIIINDRSVITPEPYGYYYSPYWMRMQTNVYQYTEGTLILDLMDAKTNSLVWRGWAVSAVDMVYTSEQVDHLIKLAIAKIFRKFPYTKDGQTPSSRDVVLK